MSCSGDTLIVEGPLTMTSLHTSGLTVKGVLQMRDGWNIQTGDHLHIRKGQGIQIANDGNIHLDNRGWISELMVGVRDDRLDKIRRERERLAEIIRQAALAAQRAAEAAAQAAHDAWNRARRWRPW